MILKTSFLTLILNCEENCFTVNAIDLKMHQLGLLLGHYSFYLKFLFFRRCFSSEIRLNHRFVLFFLFFTGILSVSNVLLFGSKIFFTVVSILFKSFWLCTSSSTSIIVLSSFSLLLDVHSFPSLLDSILDDPLIKK